MYKKWKQNLWHVPLIVIQDAGSTMVTGKDDFRSMMEPCNGQILHQIKEQNVFGMELMRVQYAAKSRVSQFIPLQQVGKDALAFPPAPLAGDTDTGGALLTALREYRDAKERWARNDEWTAPPLVLLITDDKTELDRENATVRENFHAAEEQLQNMIQSEDMTLMVLGVGHRQGHVPNEIRLRRLGGTYQRIRQNVEGMNEKNGMDLFLQKFQGLLQVAASYRPPEPDEQREGYPGGNPDPQGNPEEVRLAWERVFLCGEGR